MNLADPEREFDYTAGAEQSLERAKADGLDRRQHQERLGYGLRRRAAIARRLRIIKHYRRALWPRTEAWRGLRPIGFYGQRRLMEPS